MLVTGREDDFAEQEAEAGGAPPTWLVKVKIMLGLFQIVGAMPWSLPDVSFPARLLPVVAWANYLNFDLLSWVPMECGRFGYFDQLVSTTLAPLAGLGVVAWSAAARRATAAAMDRRAEIYSQGTYAALLLTFCVLPGCSSITFRFLSCARYDAGDYEDDLLVLHADPAVECRGDRWNAWRGYVGLMLCVYPVGIPLSYFCVLYRLQRELDRFGGDRDSAPTSRVDAAQVPRREYEPRCYLFSVFECFRRASPPLGADVFAFGGATQAAMGLLISLVSYKVYAVAAPFIEDDDDLVSEVAQLELVFVFFSALMLVVADTAEGETSHARAIFSAFLGLAFALGLAVVVFIVAVELWGQDAVLAPPASPEGRVPRQLVSPRGDGAERPADVGEAMSPVFRSQKAAGTSCASASGRSSNIGETLDAALEPILLQQTFKQGGQDMMKLGESTIPYNEEFRFRASRAALGATVELEMPDLAEKKSQLVVQQAQMNKQLFDIESEILLLLSNSTGNILDDTNLIETLAQAKKTSDEVQAKMKAEITTVEVNKSSEEYRPVAKRSLLYFCLADLANVDPMYQYALPWFKELFATGVKRAPMSNKIEERIVNLNEFFTYFVYTNVCRSLFERHKLLFSFLATIKIMMGDDKVDQLEWRFVISGQTIGSIDLPNPDPDWIEPNVWSEIKALGA
ncbi:dynein light chain binding protein [Aureococcus anophagefferens]|nr:dynein light chain binding protein [Aureococcus anophagefferens]